MKRFQQKLSYSPPKNGDFKPRNEYDFNKIQTHDITLLNKKPNMHRNGIYENNGLSNNLHKINKSPTD